MVWRWVVEERNLVRYLCRSDNFDPTNQERLRLSRTRSGSREGEGEVSHDNIQRDVAASYGGDIEIQVVKQI